MVAGGDCRRLDHDVEIAFAIRLKHRQGALIISAPGGDEAASVNVDRPLVRAYCLATRWADLLAKGEVGSLKELAREQGFCNHYAARLMPLAWLAPDLAQQILEGRQPRAIQLSALVREPLPMDWAEQRRLFKSLG